VGVVSPIVMVLWAGEQRRIGDGLAIDDVDKVAIARITTSCLSYLWASGWIMMELVLRFNQKVVKMSYLRTVDFTIWILESM